MGGSFVVAQSARDDAAAINLAGSLRMQAYRIALLVHSGESPDRLEASIQRFGEILNRAELHRAIERNQHVLGDDSIAALQIWHRRLASMFATAVPAIAGQVQLKGLPHIEQLVTEIDALTAALQIAAERRLTLLRVTQLAAIGLILLLITVAVVRLRRDFSMPLSRLVNAVERMSRGDLSVRIADVPDNEIGLVAHQCNEMAARLGRLQDNLAAEVDAKTEALRRRNQALAQESEEKQLRILTEERAIIARELHDSLAQSLSYLKIQVTRLRAQLAEKRPDAAVFEDALNELHDGLNKAYQHLRELLTTFRLQIAQPDIATALQAVTQEFSHRPSAPAIRLEIDKNIPVLTADQRVHLVHIAREALSNVFHHSKASQVHVVLSAQVQSGLLVLSIEDDGVGFAPEGDLEAAGHFGLNIMRERAWQLGGSWQVKCLAQGGTKVEVGVPLP